MTARSSTTSTPHPERSNACSGLASSQQPTPALPTNEPGGKRNGPTPLAGTPPRRGHRPCRIPPAALSTLKRP